MTVEVISPPEHFWVQPEWARCRPHPRRHSACGDFDTFRAYSPALLDNEPFRVHGPEVLGVLVRLALDRAYGCTVAFVSSS